MAKRTLQRCGNCGRTIQSNQPQLAIKVKYGLDYYHETWEGCFEATRDLGVIRTKVEEDLQTLSWASHI